MSTRSCLGLACVALVAALGGCGRSDQASEKSAPDATTVNASAVPVASMSGSGPGSDTHSADSTDTCHSAIAHRFIGQLDSPATRAALAAAVGKAAVRWIKPGSAVTQELQPARLNVIVVEDDRIGSLRCG